MSRGKYLSLEEARKLGRIEQFITEHPSKSEGVRFERLLNEIITDSSPSLRILTRDVSFDCTD